MKQFCITIGAGLMAVIGATSAHAEGVHLTVENIRNNQGNIVVLVFDNAAAFDQVDYRKAVDYAELPARAGTITHKFPLLTKGPYAIFLFHDEDGDWDIAYKGNHLLEGVGASGAPNPEDMPDFNGAAIGPGSVAVTVHYDK